VYSYYFVLFYSITCASQLNGDVLANPFQISETGEHFYSADMSRPTLEPLWPPVFGIQEVISETI
jgi:hypothetical protein